MQRNHGSARAEAERLVATVLAMASTAGAGGSGSAAPAPRQEAPRQEAPRQEAPRQEAPRQEAPRQEAPRQAGGWATGTPECCVCPLCKVIAGLRDPSPETAERLATGVGDFAAGVASLLRAFSAVAPGPPTPSSESQRSEPQRSEPPSSESQRSEPQPAEPCGEPIAHANPQVSRVDVDSVWSAATAASDAFAKAGRGSSTIAQPHTDGDPWAAATAAGDTPTARATVPRRTRSASPSWTVTPVAPSAPGADPWAAATTNAAGTYSADGTHIEGRTGPTPTARVAGKHDAGKGDEARPDGVV